MDITYFLRFYTAFAEDKAPIQAEGKAEARASQRDPPVDIFPMAPCKDKFTQDTGARAH
jgi:hypothetical protein